MFKRIKFRIPSWEQIILIIREDTFDLLDLLGGTGIHMACHHFYTVKISIINIKILIQVHKGNTIKPVQE